MPRAPVADRLRHMLDAIARIETLTVGKSFEDYAANWVIRDAVERNLERVSEASRHIPSDLKTQHKSVPWRAVAGLGNVLRHDYPRLGAPGPAKRGSSPGKRNAPPHPTTGAPRGGKRRVRRRSRSSRSAR